MIELKRKIDIFLEEFFKKRAMKNIDLVRYETVASSKGNSFYVRLFTENEMHSFRRTLRISDHHTIHKGPGHKEMIIKHPNKKSTIERVKRRVLKEIKALLITREKITINLF